MNERRDSEREAGRSRGSDWSGVAPGQFDLPRERLPEQLNGQLSERLREPSHTERKRTALLVALIVGAASDAIGFDPERAAAALFERHERSVAGNAITGVRRWWE